MVCLANRIGPHWIIGCFILLCPEKVRFFSGDRSSLQRNTIKVLFCFLSGEISTLLFSKNDSKTMLNLKGTSAGEVTLNELKMNNDF